MPLFAKPRNAAELASNLSHVVEHFERLGVPLMRGRIRAYAEVIEAVKRGGQFDDSMWGLWFSAACEIADLVAASSLDPAALHPVQHRLSTVCGGDPVFTDQSGDDPGRNLCFELVTGAMLQQNGTQSKFQNPSDVTNVVGGFRLLVECKRPTTLPALGRRLKEGYRQMSEHRRHGHTGFGAIALDVSTLVNPSFGILVGKDATTAVEHVYGHIQRVIWEAKDYLARAGRNLRQDADVHLLLFRVRCMTSGEQGPPNETQVWQLEPTVHLRSPEFQALYSFMQRQPAFTPGVTVLDPNDRRFV